MVIACESVFMPLLNDDDEKDDGHIVITLPGSSVEHTISRKVSHFSLKEKSIMAHTHARKWERIVTFVLPLCFSLVPAIVLLSRGPQVLRDFDMGDFVIPVVCFTCVTAYHVKIIFFTKRQAVKFFSRIRLAWVKQGFGKGAMEYINTLRDLMRVTIFLGSKAMLLASLLSTLAFKRFSRCKNMTIHGCDARTIFETSQMLALIMHHFFVFVNLLQATRFAMHASFMLNTTQLNGRPIRPDALVSIVSRASLFYDMGLRQFYFSMPLFAWLLGPYVLIVVSLLYVAFIYYVESVDSFIELIHDCHQKEHQEAEQRRSARMGPPERLSSSSREEESISNLDDTGAGEDEVALGGGGGGNGRRGDNPPGVEMMRGSLSRQAPSTPIMGVQEEGDEDHVVITLPGRGSVSMLRRASLFSVEEKSVMKRTHAVRRWEEIVIFVMPLCFSFVPVAILLSQGHRVPQEFNVEDFVIPVVCFTCVTAYHVKIIFFTKKQAVNFFARIRLAWAKQGFGKGAMEHINTLRDFIKVTTFLGSQAMLLASLLSTLAFKRFSRCKNMTIHGCDARTIFETSQMLALITHHFFVFVNLLQATRFAMHASFMLNTTQLNGRPIRPDALIAILSRANLFYALGLRQFYFDMVLFPWLLGAHVLIPATILYVAFIYYVESVDSFMELIHDTHQKEHQKGGGDSVARLEKGGGSIGDPPPAQLQDGVGAGEVGRRRGGASEDGSSVFVRVNSQGSATDTVTDKQL